MITTNVYHMRVFHVCTVNQSIKEICTLFSNFFTPLPLPYSEDDLCCEWSSRLEKILERTFDQVDGLQNHDFSIVEKIHSTNKKS